MKKAICFLVIFHFINLCVAQNGWTICNTPLFNNRVDDVFMANPQIGYAVCGDGQIIKTIDSGNNWFLLMQDTNVYFRSAEFVNSQIGFVGGFKASSLPPQNILLKTTDGGGSWTDLTSLLDTSAQKGICGLCVADTNTIYGCGWWGGASGFIIKSVDGGNSWNFINMGFYASSIIDMHFLNKDTGFAVGRGTLPLGEAVVLQTFDGGQNWTIRFQNSSVRGYCWKIQHLTDQIYFTSIENMPIVPFSKILKSTDGGITWAISLVDSLYQNIEGTGFIDSLKGWTGGGSVSFETNDGGATWDTINICPLMNRVFKVNDTLLFASGGQIWKYNPVSTGIIPVSKELPYFAKLKCKPNPTDESLTIELSLLKYTHAMLMLFDEKGNLLQTIENADKPKGIFSYTLSTKDFSAGTYNLILKTHEDKVMKKFVVSH